ncbi:hypothetical protein [Mycolicibacterium llatzerense]|uniref:hypothetical protein n=1 Tax=Mycolicibacterium llatzerense TaxID=280871 RepID=UPI0021B65E77|nr:hypothetical protein [Mycolicibacterium llatzerense]MCT7361326.1 hypothetical protein [Mycolicibacterium llatzerense]
MPDLHETLTAARDSVLDRVDMAKYWLRNAGRPYPPIEVLRATAVLGLNSNPTITAYTFENGVEHRHDANPFTKVMAAFAQLADQMNKSTDRLRDFFQALADHANANRKS